MHGLRCDPALLGWTRLLDEWLVGLTRIERTAIADAVCWDDAGQTLGTLADAATRVRRFAYRETEIEPTLPLDDAILRFELQGRVYRVATEQHWPAAAEVASASADRWLGAAEERALSGVAENELPLAAVFVTPRLDQAGAMEARFDAARSFIAASRSVRCSGCAFSFPAPSELARYRYGNDVHPGVLLLVRAAA